MDKKEIFLYDFAREMIRFERGKLKDIADLVMVYNQEKQTQREIQKRAGRHNSPPEDQAPTDNSN